MAWRAARSLIEFHRELKQAYPRSAPPSTDVNSWGIIGDLDHSNTSDHSPHNFPGWGNEIVTAADWPHAPNLGLDAGAVAEALRLSRDARIKYVIWNHRMFSSYSSGSTPGWSWRSYSGADPHNTHAHLSVVGDSRADETQPWSIGSFSQESVMAFLDDPNAEAMAWRIDAWNSMSPVIRGGARKDEEVPFVGAVVALAVKLDGIANTLTAPPITLTGEQIAQLGNLIATNLATNATFLTAVANAVLDEDNARSAE